MARPTVSPHLKRNRFVIHVTADEAAKVTQFIERLREPKPEAEPDLSRFAKPALTVPQIVALHNSMFPAPKRCPRGTCAHASKCTIPGECYAVKVK